MKAKIICLLEVGASFVVMVFLFRLVASSRLSAMVTSLSGGYLVLPYIILLIAASALYFYWAGWLRIPALETLKNQVSVAGYGFFPMLVLSTALSWIDWKSWPGALLVAGIVVCMLAWFAWMARDKPARQKMAAAGFLLFPFALQRSPKVAGVLAAIVFYYGLVAFGEEIFFRGYVQSRLNAVFGRPNQFWGIRWGWGLVASSVLFGLWHLAGASGAGAWPHVFWTAFAGLFLGLVREKSEGITAPALLHGVLNYGPQAALFALLSS